MCVPQRLKSTILKKKITQHQEGPFWVDPFEKNLKMLILVFEANNATSQSQQCKEKFQKFQKMILPSPVCYLPKFLFSLCYTSSVDFPSSCYETAFVRCWPSVPKTFNNFPTPTSELTLQGVPCLALKFKYEHILQPK